MMLQKRLRPGARAGVASASACLVLLVVFAPAPASAQSLYRLSWEGQFESFSLDGFFSFDESQVPADGIVRPAQLTAFDFVIRDGSGVPLREFSDNHTTMPGFNFNFDTNTGLVLQAGRFDGPDGINIGDERMAGLNFWSIDGPVNAPPGTPPNPHVHVTDWGDEFPQYLIAFAGTFEHLDGAFFERTAAQVNGNPNAGDAFGLPLVAVAIPEPSTAVLFLMLAAATRPGR